MTAPQQTPGGQREDTALAVGAAVGVLMTAAAMGMLALLGPAILKVLAGGNRRLIGRQVHAAAAAIIGEAIRRADTKLAAAEQQIIVEITGHLTFAVPGRAFEPPADQVRSLRSVADSIRDAGLNALRETDDAFRAAAELATANQASERQTAQRMLDDLAERGLSVFTDKAGREWDLASYCEMAVRTAATRLALMTQLQLMGPAGMDLVVVDSPSGLPGCRKCAPYEGRVLSLSGRAMTGALVAATDVHGIRRTANVVGSLSEAVARGLLHPNCRHFLMPFVDGAHLPVVGATRGFVQGGSPTFRVVIPQDDSTAYRADQKQRELTRLAQRAAAKKAVALTPLARARAGRGLAAARADLTEHVNSRPTGEPLTRLKPGVLSAEERSAVSYYTGMGYSMMNRYVQLGFTMPGYYADDAEYTDLIARHVRNLESAIDRFPEVRAMRLTRMIPSDTADKVFGPVGSKVGREYTENRFTSTSKLDVVPHSGQFGDVTMRILLRSGAKGLDVDRVGNGAEGEQEVILAPGQRFRVVSDRVVGGKRVIEVQAI